MSNKKAVNFYKFSFLILVLLLIYGCAAQQPPQGGPRDQTPPKALKILPANKTRNFAAKEIDMEFDEFIKLANTYQEISISPAMEKQPEYSFNKKKLKIEFKDTLEKNTTYVINFGKAIQDVNESNVLKNFTYVFSTGNHIDSLSIAGTVTNTLTQEKEKDITVFLFPLRQDSLLFGKKKPSIYTTTDSSGNFSLNNLKEQSYRIYALKEASPNKIFDNDNELIAFLKKPIKLRSDTSNVQLNLFKQTPEKFRFTDKRIESDGKMSFIFNKPLIKPSLKILYPTGLDDQKTANFSATKDSASIYLRNMAFDSISVAFFDNNKPVDTTFLLKSKKETFTRVFNYKYNFSNNMLKSGTDLLISTGLPIESIESALVTLREDSLLTNDFTIQKDTGNTAQLRLKYRWRENSRYELILNDGALTSIYGDKSKKTARAFNINKADNYSNLTLKITIPDTSKAYVVELLDDQKRVLRSDPVTKNTSLVYKSYIMGKYMVRAIYDDDRNGKWDSGNVRRRKQPENIWLYGKTITLRPNWEAEEAITIPKEQLTP